MNKTEIQSLIDGIKNETINGANTKERIATVLKEINDNTSQNLQNVLDVNNQTTGYIQINDNNNSAIFTNYHSNFIQITQNDGADTKTLYYGLPVIGGGQNDFYYPSKPQGIYTLATLDDITMTTIPLTGTTISNPVTGRIRIESSNITNNGSVTDSETGVYFSPDDVSVGYYDPNGDSIQKYIGVSAIDGVYVEDNTLDSRGIRGNQNYSSNITDLDYTQKIYVDQKVADSKPYMVYTALLSQAGTSAPVATNLENTFGDLIVYTYLGNGYYKGELDSGAAPLFQNGIVCEQHRGIFTNEQSESSQLYSITITVLDDYSFTISTRVHNGSEANDLLYQRYFEIRVYN